MLSLLIGFLLAAVGAANLPGSIWEPTECKTCPYSLCTNKKVYDRGNTIFTCWTSGTDIYTDTTWLKTTDNCYVARYDVEEFADPSELPYCGRVQQPEWPKRNGRTRYYSECYRMPYLQDRARKYYKNNVDLNLLCVARNVTGYAHEVMGKTYVGSYFLGRKLTLHSTWYKTNSDCFVHETGIWPIEDDLEDCGPLDTELPERILPETETTIPTSAPTLFPTPTTVLPNTAQSTSASVASTDIHPLSRRFLYNTTIGEEYVNCTETSNSKDRVHGVRHVYEFDQPVFPQCGTVDQFGPHPDNYTIMLFTTDFCWIRDDECWEQLLQSSLRSDHFPHCESFTDTVS
ncbi:hypothetical protein PSPO01_04257 [Paraphaeosphaeria sporulosa]